MEIKGQINFSVKKHENGAMELSYDQNLENDIGALAVSQAVLVEMEKHFKRMKQFATEKQKGAPKLKTVNGHLEKVTKAMMGIQFLTGYNLSAYEHWQKEKEAAAKAKEENAAEA